MDSMEFQQRLAIAQINGGLSEDLDVRRAQLVAKYGKDNVWYNDEISRDFEVLGFGAPVVVVRRKSDGQKGSLEFCHSPRFYFDFRPA